MRTLQLRLTVLALASSLAVAVAAQDLTLPNKPKDTLKFAVIGDSGTGDSNQYRLAKVFTDIHKRFPYEFVLMMGDNMYGGESTRDFQRKFEIPYKPVLDKNIKFYASLGNHDSPNQRMYKLFNMNGERYYSFRPKPGIRFFALDSNYMDRTQLQWLEKELAASGSDWKIMFFHHPIYSSGGSHGSDTALRDQLEPLFLKYGVDVVFAGHEHFYERLKPQKGIHYFISGGAGKLRKGDVGGEFTEKAFDSGFHFMIFEIDGDKMHFQAISDQAKTVDSGIVERRRVDDKAAPSVPAAPAVKPVPPQDKPDTPTAKPAAPGPDAIDRRAGNGEATAKPAGRALVDGLDGSRRELLKTRKPSIRSSRRIGGFLRPVTPEIFGPAKANYLKPQLCVDLERTICAVDFHRVPDAIAARREIRVLSRRADDGNPGIGRGFVKSSRQQSVVFQVPHGR